MNERIDLNALHAAWAEDIERTSSTNYVVELMKSFPECTPILIANTLAGHLASMLREAGLPIGFVVYLCAPTQYRKTTIAKLCAIDTAHEPSSQIINLHSSKAAIQQTCQNLANTCILIDDLYQGEKASAKRTREERLSEIIRVLSNDSLARTMWSDGTPIAASVVVTAEYQLSCPSTRARCVAICLAKPIDGPTLTSFQHTPERLGQCLRHFSQWVHQNAAKIQEFLQRRAKRLIDEKKNFAACPRLLEAKFILETVLMLFVNYCRDIRVQSACVMQLLNSSFEPMIREATLEDKKATLANIPLSRIIRNAIKREKWNLAKKKKAIAKDEKDAIIWNDCLCIKPGSLLKEVISCRGQPTTVSNLSRGLHQENLLVIDASGAMTKKIEGVRLYHLPLSSLKLERAAIDQWRHPSWEEMSSL